MCMMPFTSGRETSVDEQEPDQGYRGNPHRDDEPIPLSGTRQSRFHDATLTVKSIESG